MCPLVFIASLCFCMHMCMHSCSWLYNISRTWHSQFSSRVLLVWIQSFPFSRLVALTKVKELSLPYYLPLARALAQSEMQTASSRIWTHISDSIHHNNNCNSFYFTAMITQITTWPKVDPLSWGCRIHQLHLCGGVRLPQQVSLIWH